MELSELFDEFVEEYNQDKDPRVEDYLCRCSSNEKKFQNLIDVFFMARHNLPSGFRHQSWQLFSESFFSDEMNSLKQLEPMALGDALIYLSRKFEMPRRSVVKALMKRLRLDTKNQAKVERFHWQYHRLENNFINPKQVSRRLLEVAAAVFQIPVSYLEDAQQRSDYLATAPSTEMKIAARVAETRGIYRERSPQPQADDQFEEIDQLFMEVKDNVE
ncbi:TPA: hypothetical protein EYP66_14800 [Candidatus Poribacteria bacterium]|nr:hypothetical protein [Candidatus Poribacteria bacterium]